MSFVDLPRFKNNSTDYMSQKISEKVRRKKIMGNISKKSAEKNPQIPQNPEKNCRDFLIPKIFVRLIYPSPPAMQLQMAIFPQPRTNGHFSLTKFGQVRQGALFQSWLRQLLDKKKFVRM
jgi:hypothetical protein